MRTSIRDLVTIEEVSINDLGDDQDVLYDADIYCRQEYLQEERDSYDFLFLIYPVVVVHKEINDE